MLNITLANDCSRLEVTTDTPDTIGNILSTPSDTCCFKLTLGTNCCLPNTSISIPGSYTFEVAIVECGFTLVNDINYPYIDIQITGLEIECFSEVKVTRQHIQNGYEIYTEFSTNIFRSILYNTNITSYPYTIEITTTCGYTYTLTFTVDFTDVCVYTINGFTITNPAYPAGIEVNAGTPNTLYIYPEAFGQTGTELLAGIYFVSLQEDNDPIQSNSIFVDCDVLCKVIDYISKYPTSNLYGIFEALQMSDDCTAITYAQKCSLWNYLGRRLGYFSTTPCTTTSNCSPCTTCKSN